MKEAAGEANMTVITIVLIAIVLGVGTLIVTNLMRSSGQSTACTGAGGTWQNGRCFRTNTCTRGNDGRLDCTNATRLNCTETNGNWTCQ